MSMELQDEWAEEEAESSDASKRPPGAAPGAETLFRNLSRVHVAVSAMADNKANFLISVNSIILVLSAAHGKEIVTDRILLFPAALVIFSCIGSMVFAALAARPRITRCRNADPKSPGDRNLLFFGSFAGLRRDVYIDALTAVSKDTDSLYRAMSADIYDTGVVLQKKFKRLEVAYGFLLFGMPGGLFFFLVLQAAMRLLGHD